MLKTTGITVCVRRMYCFISISLDISNTKAPKCRRFTFFFAYKLLWQNFQITSTQSIFHCNQILSKLQRRRVVLLQSSTIFFQTSKKSKLSINTANNWILIWTTPICKKLHKFMTMKTSYSLPALVAQKKKDLFVISEGGLGWFLKYNKRINWKGIDVIFNYPATVICDYWRTIYTTENFWLGADKNGTHTKKQMVQHG